MLAVKDYQPTPAQDLTNILRYTALLWQAQKPDSQDTKPSLSDKVNASLPVLPPQNIPVNSSNYSPLMPYGLAPYQVSNDSYGIIGAYLDRRIEAMHDFTDRVPGKHLNTFPSSGNEGLFGFTYLGDVHVWRRDDLIGTKFAEEVDVHESSHTDNEYETKRIVEWMMSKERPKYIIHENSLG